MTPKEKSEELVQECYNLRGEWKLTAIKVCDEILNLMIINFKWDKKHNGNIIYWEEVKQEIENL